MIKWGTLLGTAGHRDGKDNGAQSASKDKLGNEPKTAREKVDSWLRAAAGEDDEVKNMILRDLMGGDKDFLNA